MSGAVRAGQLAAGVTSAIPGVGQIISGVLGAVLSLVPVGTGGPREVARLLAAGATPEQIAFINCNAAAFGYSDGALALRAVGDYLGIPRWQPCSFVPIDPRNPKGKSRRVCAPDPPRYREALELINARCGV